MSRAGRKRAQQAKREQNGRAQRGLKPEREDKIMGIVLAQPHRRGERSQLVAYALGRLLHTQQISIEQFNALETYTRLASRYMRDVLGSSYHWPRSSIANMANGGAWATFNTDPDEESVEQTQRDWADAMNAFADNGLMRAIPALARICLMDMDPVDDQLGDARLAANVLHRLWGSKSNRRRPLARFDADSQAC
jgi:hypothetical protein